MQNIVDDFCSIWKQPTFALIDFVRHCHRTGYMISDSDAENLLESEGIHFNEKERNYLIT